MRRDVFQAIADPTRREIIKVIAGQKTVTVNGVADAFNISRQAVSKHVKILTECGLVIIKQQGRERYCEATLGKLNEVAAWIEPYRKLWEGRFDAMSNLLDELQKKGPAK